MRTPARRPFSHLMVRVRIVLMHKLALFWEWWILRKFYVPQTIVDLKCLKMRSMKYGTNADMPFIWNRKRAASTKTHLVQLARSPSIHQAKCCHWAVSFDLFTSLSIKWLFYDWASISHAHNQHTPIRTLITFNSKIVRWWMLAVHSTKWMGRISSA